jgi:redox-sensitive bicupin YhaK (pirin superfamily)
MSSTASLNSMPVNYTIMVFTTDLTFSKDSMGNIEILKRGDLQLTSAGTGISHSEKAYGSKEVHFLQIWSVPSVSKLTPKYFTR